MPRGGREEGSSLSKCERIFVTLEKGFPEDHGQQKGVKNNMTLQKKETLCHPQLSSHVIMRICEQDVKMPVFQVKPPFFPYGPVTPLEYLGEEGRQLSPRALPRPTYHIPQKRKW